MAKDKAKAAAEEKKIRERKAFLSLLKYAGRQKGRIALGLIFVFAGSVTDIYIPIFIG